MKFTGLWTTLSVLFCMKHAHSWSSVLGGVVMLLLVLPCSNISRLKSPANMMVYLGCFSMIF